jgi:hypothetical protein
MRTKIAVLSAVLISIIVSITTTHAKPRKTSPEQAKERQIVVRVHKSPKGLEYEMRSYGLKKGEANYWLAEIKLRECNDCQVIPIIDDNVELGGITEISEMAINAGFKDIRPFVYWRKTGRMAEIQFGPPVKFTANEAKLEQRIEKAQ